MLSLAALEIVQTVQHAALVAPNPMIRLIVKFVVYLVELPFYFRDLTLSYFGLQVRSAPLPQRVELFLLGAGELPLHRHSRVTLGVLVLQELTVANWSDGLREIKPLVLGHALMFCEQVEAVANGLNQIEVGLKQFGVKNVV